MKIQAKVIADSLNQFGNRLTTMVIDFPRYILAELNTHRALSKNSASSRAKPFKTLLKSVETDPFIPIAWMQEHKGMQGTKYFMDDLIKDKLWMLWKDSSEDAINSANLLSEEGLTKQIVNRILEPYLMHQVVISGTEWENFFGLRCPQYEVNDIPDKTGVFSSCIVRSRKEAIQLRPELAELTDIQWRERNSGMADIHIMDLAEAMWDAMADSRPRYLISGDWHMPYTDDINLADFYRLLEREGLIDSVVPNQGTSYDILLPFLLKVSAARCARISYKTFGEDSKIDLMADIRLHDNLLVSQPIHASPAEHQGRSMTSEELDNNLIIEDGKVTLGVSRNFRGFKQYRTFLNNETIY